MGRGDNRLTRKVRQRRAQRKKKAAALRKIGAGQNK